MIHQPSGGAQGQATDIEIHAREILKTREQLNRIYAERTGQTLEKIAADMERDCFMSADRGDGLRPDRPGDRQARLSRHRHRAPKGPNRPRFHAPFPPWSAGGDGL